MYVKIENLTLSNGKRGIQLQGGVFANVKKCIIENNFYDGIGAWTQTTLIVEESTIHNNGLSNDWGSGVSVWDVTLELLTQTFKTILMEKQLGLGLQ